MITTFTFLDFRSTFISLERSSLIILLKEGLLHPWQNIFIVYLLTTTNYYPVYVCCMHICVQFTVFFFSVVLFFSKGRNFVFSITVFSISKIFLAHSGCSKYSCRIYDICSLFCSLSFAGFLHTHAFTKASIIV